ncbi:MAG: NB-ARC domain-containing protein [Bacteroidota bacterium]
MPQIKINMPLSSLFHKNIPSDNFHNISMSSSYFLNRKKDLLILKHYLLEDRFRIISISGEAGIGKTSTANRFAKLIISLSTDFHSIVWTSAKQYEPKPPKKNSILMQEYNRKKLSESKGQYANDIHSLFNLIMNITEGKIQIREKERNISEKEIMSRLKIRKTLIIIDDLDSWTNWEEVLDFARRIPHPSAILITTRRSLYGTIPGLASHRLNLLEDKYVKAIVERKVKQRNLNFHSNDINTITSFAQGNPLYAILATGFTNAVKSTNPTASLIDAFLTNDNLRKESIDVFNDLHLHMTSTAKNVLSCLCALLEEGKNANVQNIAKLLKTDQKTVSYGLYELDYISLINRKHDDNDPYDIHDLIREYVKKINSQEVGNFREKAKFI